jgi:hypothetical protein
MTLSVSLPEDNGGRFFNGPDGKIFRGSNSSGDYADTNVVLYDASGSPLLTAVDMDTGAGVANRAAVGLLLPASGGPVVAPGDATNGLKVQAAQLPTALTAGGRLKMSLEEIGASIDQGAGPVNASTLRINTVSYVVATATVPSGQALSSAVAMIAYRECALVTPATFDGSGIEFQVSDDNVTFYTLRTHTGAVVSMLTVIPSAAYDLPGELAKWPFFCIHCHTTQTTTSTAFKVVMKS